MSTTDAAEEAKFRADCRDLTTFEDVRQKLVAAALIRKDSYWTCVADALDNCQK